MHKTGYVIYIDGLGKSHDAIVRAINPMHPSFVTLTYVDEKADERDNLITLFDVAHKEHESRADVRTFDANNPNFSGTKVTDGNPNLPHYDQNVWMERDEDHTPLPEDHPAFDHPWKQPEYDQSGNRIEIQRPKFDADVAAHVASLPQADGDSSPTSADLDAVAEEQAAKEATMPKKNNVRQIKGK